MFGNKSDPSKIYSYGCLPPTTGAEDVEEQMRLGHQYRNELVRLELDRRERVRAALAAACPKIAGTDEMIAAAETELELVSGNVADERMKARSKKSGPAARIREELIVALKELRVTRKALVTEAVKWPAVKAALDQVAAGALDRQKELRSKSGLYWGSYLAIEQAMADAKSGMPPKFHRWTGEGRIAVQVQKGMSVEELIRGEDQRCRLVLTGEHGRGGRPFGEFWMRVGSNGRDPVWCVIPFVYHRPIPEDGQIKWAYLHRRRCGTNWRWTLSLVVARKAGWPILDAAPAGEVLIGVGWKAMPDGLQVAYWEGSDGQTGTLTIPAADIKRWIDPAERRSDRDTLFDVQRDRLADWLDSGAIQVPEWLTEITDTIRQWRSVRRLAGVVNHWRTNRFPGDDDTFDWLDTWERQDRREYDSEAGQRARALRWRDDLYRVFVAGLRRTYRKAVIKEVNYADLAIRPDDRYTPDTPATNRFIASPGRLVALIKEGFVEVEVVPRERGTLAKRHRKPAQAKASV